MRVFVLSALFLWCISVSGQETAGIKFERGLSWVQLKQKAKEEKKYIFMDCFTTWCAPCKVMEQEVFTRKNVGDFFNASFINVKVQFDSTKKDNDEVRSWYSDVNDMKNKFAIQEFPTYLFFDPDGNLVHKIIGGSVPGDEFLTKSKAALNPSSQYYRLKANYDEGRRDVPFLRTLLGAVQAAREAADHIVIANEYLSHQKADLTENDMKLISGATFKTSDVGFKVLREQSKKALSPEVRGKASGIVRSTVIEEIVVPLLRNGGKVERYGPMLMYTGELVEKVSWDTLKLQVAIRFPDLVEEVVMASQIMYFEWVKDWPKFCQTTSAFISKYKDRVDAGQLNIFGWSVINAQVDIQCAGTAVGWIQKAINDTKGKNPDYLFTGAALLYKAERKDEAIAKIKHMIAVQGDSSGQLARLLDQMSKREKIF